MIPPAPEDSGAGSLTRRGMRTISFPDDMRDYTVTRKQIFLTSLRLSIPLWVCIIVFCLAASIVPTLWEYGEDAILHLTDWIGGALFTAAACLAPVAALFFLGVYLAAHRQKIAGTPIAYGFDDKGIYIWCDLSAGHDVWEMFRSWREFRHFFIFYDGNRRVMWPKALWTDEECEAIRAHLRAKASPAPYTRNP